MAASRPTFSSAYGSSMWIRRASVPRLRRPPSPTAAAASTAASMEWRAINSCALAVKASASASNVVASALARRARMVRSALASISPVVPAPPGGPYALPALLATHRDGGGSSGFSRPAFRSTARSCTAPPNESAGCRRSALAHLASTSACPPVNRPSVGSSTPSSANCSSQRGGARWTAWCCRAWAATYWAARRPSRWVNARRVACTTSAGSHPPSSTASSARVMRSCRSADGRSPGPAADSSSSSSASAASKWRPSAPGPRATAQAMSTRRAGSAMDGSAPAVRRENAARSRCWARRCCC